MTTYYIPPIIAGAELPTLVDGDTVEIDRAWGDPNTALAAANARIPMGTTTLKAVVVPSPDAVWVGE